MKLKKNSKSIKNQINSNQKKTDQNRSINLIFIYRDMLLLFFHTKIHLIVILIKHIFLKSIFLKL
jgi:hypothetical protein